MPTTEFLFMRHGHSTSNVLGDTGIIRGRADDEFPLTKIGVDQCTTTGGWLKTSEYKPDVIISSPALRAMETAKIIGDILQVPTDLRTRDTNLREICLGDWEGKDKETIFTPNLMMEIRAKKGHYKAPGGESLIDVQNRMKLSIESFIQKYSGSKVMIVSHSQCMRVLAHGIEYGWADENILDAGYRLGNTGMMKIVHRDDTTHFEMEFLDNNHLTADGDPKKQGLAYTPIRKLSTPEYIRELLEADVMYRDQWRKDNIPNVHSMPGGRLIFTI